jgi:multidrug efflux system membrane fusion protein
MTEAIVFAREPTRAPSRARLVRGLLLVLVLLATGGLGWRWWQGHQATQATTAATRSHASDVVPVLVATAANSDVPIYLDALGTVQASSTVTIKPMVDGPLLEVRFREGQDVKTGDVLAKIDPRTYQAALDQAVAKKAQDEANLANARIDLTRYQRLAKTEYASQQQAEGQKATVAQLEAQVAQDQAQIDNARTQLSYTTITSPIDGRAGIRQVDAGNIVHATDTTGMVVLTALKPIAVIFTLPQQNLDPVAAAMGRGAAEVLAVSDTGATLDRGTLEVLDNQVDPTTGTIKLKATFPNTDLRLWPGGFVRVKLLVDTQNGAITVPPAAVQRGPRGAYVYVAQADGTVVRRMVEVGHEDVQASIIVSGVAAGERVITDGASRLTDGAKITVLPAAGTPDAAPRAGKGSKAL